MRSVKVYRSKTQEIKQSRPSGGITDETQQHLGRTDVEQGLDIEF